MIRRGALVLSLVAGVLACGGSPPSAPADAVRLEIAAGDGQRGLAGETLPDGVVVRVVDSENRPVVGRRVDFQVVAGGGVVRPTSATTDASGRTGVEWSLGGREVQIQRLRATVADGSTVTVEATALGEAETDVILIRGALGPMKGVVLVEDDPVGPVVNLTVVQRWVSADTIVPIQPMDGGTTGVVAFPWANALEWTEATWTPDVDTVRVDLRPPVPVPMTITITDSPFEDRRRMVEEHLAITRQILAEQGVGVVLADVAIVDRTDGGPGPKISVTSACSSDGTGVVSDHFRAIYVHTVGGHNTMGLACPPDRLFMAKDTHLFPSLLAHEIGHLFGLLHTGNGLMVSTGPGASLTEGEIFQVHFHEGSAVNTVFEAHPPEFRRDCRSHLQAACLSAGFELR